VTKRSRTVKQKTKKSGAMTKEQKAKAKLVLQEQAAKLQEELAKVDASEETDPRSAEDDSSFSDNNKGMMNEEAADRLHRLHLYAAETW
jgi:hypothetical protein